MCAMKKIAIDYNSAKARYWSYRGRRRKWTKELEEVVELFMTLVGQ
jgi:hypothetical protein